MVRSEQKLSKCVRTRHYICRFLGKYLELKKTQTQAIRQAPQPGVRGGKFLSMKGEPYYCDFEKNQILKKAYDGG